MMWERGAAGDLARGAPGDPSLVSPSQKLMLTSRVKFQSFAPAANYKYNYNCNDNCIYRRLADCLAKVQTLGIRDCGIRWDDRLPQVLSLVTSGHRVNRSILNGPGAVNQSCHKIASSLLSQDYSRDRPGPCSQADLTLTAYFHPVSAARRFGLAMLGPGY